MLANYRPRVVDAELVERMAAAGAVVVEGPRACGKTATAEQVARTEYRFDVDEGAQALVATAPEVLFDAPTPILFDEWQLAPKVWNLVRRAVDDRSPQRGQFVLTGSATPRDDVSRHTGAGRMAVMRMRPMSLFETGHSTGQVSLRALFDSETQVAKDPGLTVPQLVERIVVGGWPGLLDADVTTGQRWVRDYLATIVADVQRLDGRRQPEMLRRLLVALGRSVGTDATIKALAADAGGADGPADRATVNNHLDALVRLMVVEDVPAWAPHMRSTTPLRKSATRFLVDPSLGVGALSVGPDQLLRDLNAAGFHFEALVVRDLRVYTQLLGGTLSHWRDNNGHEVDIVVALADGRWGALEVKMNPDHVDQAAASLLRFVDKVNLTRTGAPAFLGVVTTRSAAYRRPDGVCCLPVATLGP
ncbi:MAG: ATP-binding protein [Micrococcales bacterium]|nr:ATP-binding protein [Micrococcales bacterium]